jgi:hypothetical protein
VLPDKAGTGSKDDRADFPDSDPHLPSSWRVSVYGGNLDLRTWLEAHGYPYVVAVACNEPVGFQTPTGRRREEAALVEAFVLHDGDWQRLSMSEGTRVPQALRLGHRPHAAKVGRRMEDIGCSFVAAWMIPPKKRTTLSLPRKQPPCQRWSRPLAKDWHVEENFENGKDLGMDHYEVRSFIGWYRHYMEWISSVGFLLLASLLPFQVSVVACFQFPAPRGRERHCRPQVPAAG